MLSLLILFRVSDTPLKIRNTVSEQLKTPICRISLLHFINDPAFDGVLSISPQVCPQKESETNRIVLFDNVLVSLNQLAEIQVLFLEMVSSLFQ